MKSLSLHTLQGSHFQDYGGEKHKENVLERWITGKKTLPLPLSEETGFKMSSMVFRYQQKIQTSIFSHGQEKSVIFLQPSDKNVELSASYIKCAFYNPTRFLSSNRIRKSRDIDNSVRTNRDYYVKNVKGHFLQCIFPNISTKYDSEPTMSLSSS